MLNNLKRVREDIVSNQVQVATILNNTVKPENPAYMYGKETVKKMIETSQWLSNFIGILESQATEGKKEKKGG
jgi:hypothetical protein